MKGPVSRKNLETVRLEWSQQGLRRFGLRTRQTIPLSPERAFAFFEDPRNLFAITPPWLDFRMLDPGRSEVFEGAEFDYTIRWLGIRIPWRSRIEHYRPPAEFTDLQIRGPYRVWRHRHRFEPAGAATRMIDTVRYELPAPTIPVHRWIIRPQLESIFRYRAERIREWSEGRFDPCSVFREAYGKDLGNVFQRSENVG